MSTGYADLSNPLLTDIGYAAPRSPETPPAKHPAALKVVSADNHVDITEDIFYENFPVSIRERAPRVWFDRYWRLGFPGGQEALAPITPSATIDEFVERCFVRNNSDIAVRKSHMTAEGIDSEIVFPQQLFGWLRHKDLEVRELMYLTYNEYLSKLALNNPGRFHGVGVFSNYWDPAKADSAMQQIVDQGLKTFMIPTTLKDPLGQEMNLASEQLEHFWSAAEASGLPVNFHIGEDPVFGGRGVHATFFMMTLSPFRKPLAQLIFGGVFDRHPKLKIVFSEAGINWVAGFLQDAESYFDQYYHTHTAFVGEKPAHRPSHYWHSNCYATFQLDKIGLDMLPYIGADRVMWAADYPHTEGSFGVSWSARQAVIDATSERQARDILGGTATRVYKL